MRSAISAPGVVSPLTRWDLMSLWVRFMAFDAHALSPWERVRVRVSRLCEPGFALEITPWHVDMAVHDTPRRTLCRDAFHSPIVALGAHLGSHFHDAGGVSDAHPIWQRPACDRMDDPAGDRRRPRQK